jgi:hypothetical protein
MKEFLPLNFKSKKMEEKLKFKLQTFYAQKPQFIQQRTMREK